MASIMAFLRRNGQSNKYCTSGGIGLCPSPCFGDLRGGGLSRNFDWRFISIQVPCFLGSMFFFIKMCNANKFFVHMFTIILRKLNCKEIYQSFCLSFLSENRSLMNVGRNNHNGEYFSNFEGGAISSPAPS